MRGILRGGEGTGIHAPEGHVRAERKLRCKSMMSRDELLVRLAALKRWLAAEGATRLRVFGSHARDQAGTYSDVDLIADLDRPPGLRFFQLHDGRDSLGPGLDTAPHPGRCAACLSS